MSIVISPDGAYYLRMAMGKSMPSPYHRRWLLPYILGPNPAAWFACTWASLALTPIAAWIYFGTMGLDDHARIFAAALLIVLPGVWRCSYRFPVLTDAPSFMLALTCAWLARSGHVAASVALSCMLGGMRESGPVFVASWAWNPWPLVGMLGARWAGPCASPDVPWLAHPFREAWALRRRIGLDASLYLRPWGAALIGLVAPTWQTVTTIIVAHAQLFMAQDCIRLVAWCAPVMVASAAPHIPQTWWALALIATAIQWDERV